MDAEQTPGKKNSPDECSPATGFHLRSLEITFWDAFALATSGCVPESIPLFRAVFSRDRDWIQVLKRLLCSDRIEEERALRTILAGTGVEDSRASGRIAS